MTGQITVGRRRGAYGHKTDMKIICDLKRRKVDRRSGRSRKRVDRRQAGVASKDQIQQYSTIPAGPSVSLHWVPVLLTGRAMYLHLLVMPSVSNCSSEQQGQTPSADG